MLTYTAVVDNYKNYMRLVLALAFSYPEAEGESGMNELCQAQTKVKVFLLNKVV